MKKLETLLFFLLFSISSLIAQNPETGIKGRVVDENNAPIAFATLTLFNHADSSLVKADHSLENGSFQFTHLREGSYYLNISFVGYDTYVATPIDVKEGH